MLSKKFLSVMTSVFLLAGVGFSSTARTISSTDSENNSFSGQAYVVDDNFRLGGPTDSSIANEEKVIEMLKRERKIPANATYEQQRNAFVQYMQKATEANTANKKANANEFSNLITKQSEKIKNFEQSRPDRNAKKVNVLVLLVDYQDFKHSSIQPGQTDMYYKDYSHQHYQDMIFGDNGYIGPDGKNHISMKQYYKEQSGGSLDVEGAVAGWYTLPQTAAYYGAPKGSSNDIRPRNAVADALKEAAKDPNLNLNDYDREDIYDMDGDGNFNEPDGIVDYLMVIHAGVGQEAGGGSLGSDAIWSHSWDLGGVYTIPGTSTTVPYWGGKLGAFHYTIEPEDGATGVFAHEFGHNLGLPDEYDIAYSSTAGEPISMWSIMSSGSWAGTVPGTEPTGISPYSRQILQELYGGNWQKRINLDYNKITKSGTIVNIRQASEQGQAIRINLPDREHVLVTPTSGNYAYWGGTGVDGTPIKTNMTANVDLSGKTAATLNFKTNYDLENGWDYASVQVREVGTTNWTYLPGNRTTSTGDPDRLVIIPHGITGKSNGWVDASFDLSTFAGKKVELKIEYETDPYTFGAGFYVDDIQVVADNAPVLSDNAEQTSKFALNGFEKSTGKVTAPNYYLVEWRNYNGVDKGLAHIGVLGQNLSYDPGMVVWYVDQYYGERDNLTGVHPGHGYLSVVDADQKSIIWKFTNGSNPLLASGKYQMRDAAFSLSKDSPLTVNTDKALGRSPRDLNSLADPLFTDSKNYFNTEIPPLGVSLVNTGVKVQIISQNRDNSGAMIRISK